MSTVLKYTLMQIPGALFVGVLLMLIWQWGWLSASSAATIMALWVAKDTLLYPLYRRALESGPDTGAAALAGRRGQARTTLNPRGLVLLDGEQWQAESADARIIRPGETVRVQSAKGLVLQVEPVEAEQ